MISITRNGNKPTVLSAENGLIRLNLGSNIDKTRAEKIFSLIDEIVEDMGTSGYKGKFSFSPDKVEINLEKV